MKSPLERYFKKRVAKDLRKFYFKLERLGNRLDRMTMTVNETTDQLEELRKLEGGKEKKDERNYIS